MFKRGLKLHLVFAASRFFQRLAFAERATHPYLSKAS
jgi:hypothetical protein